MQKVQLFVRMSEDNECEISSTYHSLTTPLFTICTFNVENKDPSVAVSVHPYTFCRLLGTMFVIHSVKFGIEEQIQ